MRHSRVFFWVVVLASAAGLLLATDLTWVHYRSHNDPGYHSFCAIDESWNCQTVALSRWSVVLRVPVSVWGILAYLLYLACAVTGLRDLAAGRAGGPRGRGAIAVMTLAGAAAAVALFSIAQFVIKSKCIMCAGLYGVNALLLAAAAVEWIASRESPLGWVAADLRGFLLPPRPAAIPFAAALLAAALLVPFYPRLYRRDAPCGHDPAGAGDALPSCNEEATYGAASPRLVITEFSDYECPYCSVTHFALRKAVDAFPGKVMLKHRHFPLDMSCNPLLARPFHRNACLAARAAVCAGKQNRFWEMNDQLYRNRKRLSQQEALELARGIGLDEGRFGDCLADPSTQALVKRDIAEATTTDFVKAGMIGTPIIYIGDVPHSGAITFDEVVKVIADQLGEEAPR